MQPAWITIWLMLCAVLIAVPLGVVMAVAASCCEPGKFGRRVRGLYLVAMLCAIALPMYLHAAGWESAAGKFGWVPLMQTSGQRFWFSGFFATAWIHGIIGAAWVGLATVWGVSRIPRNLIEIAAMEASVLRSLGAVVLPLALPGIVAGALWVALLAATEMTVADLYGVRTLADLVYLRYAYDPEPMGIVLACLAPAVVAVPLLYFLLRASGQVTAVHQGPPLGWLSPIERTSGQMRTVVIEEQWPNAAPEAREPVGGRPLVRCGRGFGMMLRRGLPPVVVIVAVALVLVLPLLSLLVKAGWQVVDVEESLASRTSARYSWSPSRFAMTISESFRTFGTEYRWTAVLAVTTALPAVVVGWVAAAWADRSAKVAGVALVGAVLLVLLPGPVVGMVVVQLFHGRGEWFGWMYTQTLIPTICAQLVRAGPAAYLVIRAGYRTLDPAVADAAVTDGAAFFGRLFRIDGPRLLGTLLVAGAVAGIVATADVPASLVVLPPSVSTVGTRMFGLLHSGVRYQESGLAIGFCVGFAALLAIVGGFVSWRAGITTRRSV